MSFVMPLATQMGLQVLLDPYDNTVGRAGWCAGENEARGAWWTVEGGGQRGRGER